MEIGKKIEKIIKKILKIGICEADMKQVYAFMNDVKKYEKHRIIFVTTCDLINKDELIFSVMLDDDVVYKFLVEKKNISIRYISKLPCVYVVYSDELLEFVKNCIKDRKNN